MKETEQRRRRRKERKNKQYITIRKVRIEQVFMVWTRPEDKWLAALNLFFISQIWDHTKKTFDLRLADACLANFLSIVTTNFSMEVAKSHAGN